MNAKDELKLSYYQPVSDIDAKHHVTLVKHVESGRLFVRKETGAQSKNIYETLQEKSFAGIPHIYEWEEDGDQLIIIEEYINGTNLAGYLEENGSMTEKGAISLVLQLCNILTPLHENDPMIIHRDIKPSNIMRMDNGSIYLLDFDAGKFHEENKNRDTVLMGTAGYAAPEQYGFAQSDGRTDIYSLGVLLRELMGSETQASPECQRVIDKCTAMDPEDRYPDVDKLEKALLSAVSEKTSSHKGYEYSSLPPGFRAKKPGYMIAGALWYAFIIYVALLPINPRDDLTRIDYVFSALALLLSTFIIGNYKGMSSKVPLLRSNTKWKRILGGVVTVFLSLLLMAIIATTIDQFS